MVSESFGRVSSADGFDKTRCRFSEEGWNYTKKISKTKLRANIVLNNEEAPMHDTTNTCSYDCEVRATVPSETTVSHESRHDSKQLYNSERIQSDGDTRASTTFTGVVSAAVPHVSRRQNNYQIQ